MNRLTTTLAGGLLLAGCAAQQAIKDGKPLDPAQVQADMNNAVFIMKAAGCTIPVAAAVAAPIVSIAGDPAGGQVLNAVSAAGTALCVVVVPPSALPIPAPPNAPAVAVALKP
jgi:hypothetical protein